MVSAAGIAAVSVDGKEVAVARPDAEAIRSATTEIREASFARFDQRARAGERLNVVFFGASLTWGANASNPNETSYRARVAELLEERYPKAHLKFHDAAIGGTDSRLGVFRLQRDVLDRDPDLVFIDFTANDGIGERDVDKMQSYESLLRKIILEGKAPAVTMIFPFRWDVQAKSMNGMKRLHAHTDLAERYGVPVGDAVQLCRQRVNEEGVSIKRIWPFDGCHPGDEGYRIFADAAWQAFQKGVKERRTCRVPEKMVYGDTYMKRSRVSLSSLGQLPKGWSIGHPNLTSAWYDALMSRWLDDVAIACNRTQVEGNSRKERKQSVKPLKLGVRASSILFFGEETTISGKYRVLIDGKAVTHIPRGFKKPIDFFDLDSTKMGGNRHHTQVIATGLDTTREHIVEIIPLLDERRKREIRIESICVAGGQAEVKLLPVNSEQPARRSPQGEGG